MASVVKLVVFTVWAEIWVFLVGLMRSFTIGMWTYRPVIFVSNRYCSHLSCFPTLWPRSEIGFGHGLQCHGPIYFTTGERSNEGRFHLSYNSLATKYKAKISLWESDRLSTTGTSFMSWILLRVLTSPNSTHAEKLMQTGAHVEQPLRDGVHILSRCGRVCRF